MEFLTVSNVFFLIWTLQLNVSYCLILQPSTCLSKVLDYPSFPAHPSQTFDSISREGKVKLIPADRSMFILWFGLLPLFLNFTLFESFLPQNIYSSTSAQ